MNKNAKKVFHKTPVKNSSDQVGLSQEYKRVSVFRKQTI